MFRKVFSLSKPNHLILFSPLDYLAIFLLIVDVIVLLESMPSLEAINMNVSWNCCCFFQSMTNSDEKGKLKANRFSLLFVCGVNWIWQNHLILTKVRQCLFHVLTAQGCVYSFVMSVKINLSKDVSILLPCLLRLILARTLLFHCCFHCDEGASALHFMWFLPVFPLEWNVNLQFYVVWSPTIHDGGTIRRKNLFLLSNRCQSDPCCVLISSVQSEY